MSTKKLDKWAELLLDTGKRNNLINFKDRKAMTVEVLSPSSDVLFEKIDGSASFEVYDPKIVEEDDEAEYSAGQEQPSAVPTAEEDEIADSASKGPKPAVPISKDTDSTDKKKAYYAQYAGKMRRQNQLLLYNEGSGPLAAVKNIDKRSRAIIEETGVNVAYMAFGFIHWKENGASTADLCAPILLVPIHGR